MAVISAGHAAPDTLPAAKHDFPGSGIGWDLVLKIPPHPSGKTSLTTILKTKLVSNFPPQSSVILKR